MSQTQSSTNNFVLPSLREELNNSIEETKKKSLSVLYSSKLKIKPKFLQHPEDLKLLDPPSEKKYALRMELIKILDGKSQQPEFHLNATQTEENEPPKAQKEIKKPPKKANKVEEEPVSLSSDSEKESSSSDDTKSKRKKKKVSYKEVSEEEQEPEKDSESNSSSEEEEDFKVSKKRKKKQVTKPKPKKKKREIPTPEINRDVSNFLEYSQTPITNKNGDELKDYQIEGVNWLFDNWFQERSCILADEMGLGKTIQTIAFIDQLVSKELIKNGLFLIVVPLSTIKNWENEIKKWSKVKVSVLYGESQAERLEELEKIQDDDEKEIIVTTYNVFKIETKFFNSIEWALAVFDEGHALKGNDSKIKKDASKIQADFKILLTGTPFMNNLEDVYNLLDFLNPKQFDRSLFECIDDNETKKIEQLEKVKPLINPYILRRTKKDVEIKLPPKKEIIVEVELTNQQKTFYKAIYEKKVNFLRQKFQKKIGTQMLTSLKNVCNHPFLLDRNCENIIVNEMKTQDPNLDENQIMIQCSSKLVLVDKILTKVQKEGQKILIFSQQIEMLNILEDYLIYKKFGYVRLDGGTTSKDRTKNIEKFNTDMDCFVFLLSPLAGGLGINLISANNVILYDSSFNPFIDQQATARCHRFGQTRIVSVFRLVTRNTYENYILGRAGKKLVQGNYLLDNEDKMSKEELENLLKLGAYHIFLDDEKQSRKKDKDLLQEDIENIISKSKVIVSENSQKPLDDTSQVEGLYFAPTEEDKNIDLNDEKFWEKVLPSGFTDVETLKKMANDSGLKDQEARNQFIKKLIDSCNDFFTIQSHEKYFVDTKDSYWTLLYKLTKNDYFINDKENFKIIKDLFDKIEKRGRTTKIISKSNNFKVKDHDDDDTFKPKYEESSSEEEEEEKVKEVEKKKPSRKRSEKSAPPISVIQTLQTSQITKPTGTSVFQPTSQPVVQTNTTQNQDQSKSKPKIVPSLAPLGQTNINPQLTQLYGQQYRNQIQNMAPVVIEPPRSAPVHINSKAIPVPKHLEILDRFDNITMLDATRKISENSEFKTKNIERDFGVWYQKTLETQKRVESIPKNVVPTIQTTQTIPLNTPNNQNVPIITPSNNQVPIVIPSNNQVTPTTITNNQAPTNVEIIEQKEKIEDIKKKVDQLQREFVLKLKSKKK